MKKNNKNTAETNTRENEGGPEEGVMLDGELPQALGHLQVAEFVRRRLMRLLKLATAAHAYHKQYNQWLGPTGCPLTCSC